METEDATVYRADATILHAGRHEFVGNRGESEVRAHLRGCVSPHGDACQRYALVVN
jgi:hypothetical protein